MPGEPADWIVRFATGLIESLAWRAAVLPFILGLILSALVHGIFFLFALLGFIFIVGAWIFLASLYRNGQSFGKWVMGIRVIRADGRPPSWAYNFIVRAVLIKWLLIGVAGEITAGIFPWSTTSGPSGTTGAKLYTTKWSRPTS